MNYVAPRGVSVVCRLFVMAGVVVLGSLLVMASGMLKMFCYLPVVFSCFLRHRFSPREFRTLRLFRLRDTHRATPQWVDVQYTPLARAASHARVFNHVLRLSGTLPPLSASLVMTCLCSQTFISAEPLRAPV